MSDVLFEGHHLDLIECDQENAKGIIIACGNTHLFLNHEAVAELLQGLNRNSYEIYKTREEISQ